MGELANELVHLGAVLEDDAALPPLLSPPAWSDSKHLQREALKKLAIGQKLSSDQSWLQTMW